jgi:uncharacterized membrane protein
LPAFFVNDFHFMPNRNYLYLGLFAAFLLLLSCFLPWTSYPYVNLTFNGFNVERFVTGNYYGKAGYPIVVLTIITTLLFLVRKLWAKRVAVFISALLFAYIIRTYIIFTSGLVEGDVIKHIGIYLLVVSSAALFISSLFPYMPLQEKNAS